MYVRLSALSIPGTHTINYDCLPKLLLYSTVFNSPGIPTSTEGRFQKMTISIHQKPLLTFKNVRGL